MSSVSAENLPTQQTSHPEAHRRPITGQGVGGTDERPAGLLRSGSG